MSEQNLHLAAKWRPKSFDEVVGQQEIVDSLRGMILSKKIDPVLIFHGPYSTGKTTLARLVAYYINCQKPNGIEPCKECPSCKQMQPVLLGRSQHPDVTELNIALHGGIDEFRRLSSIAPQAPRYNFRVFILDEAHQTTAAAFQAAQKMFEDPPRRTRYILCTTEFQKLPATIRSRSAIFSTQPLPTELVARRLFHVAAQEGFKPPKEQLKQLCLQIATVSDGHLRDALNLLSTVINNAKATKSKTSDWQELLTEVVKQSTELQTSEVIRAYMKAVVTRDIPAAFSALRHVTNDVYFTQQVIIAFQQIFYFWIDEDLCDRGKLWLIKGVPRVPTPSNTVETIPAILDEYVGALERLRTYATDPLAVLEAATLRVMKMMPPKPQRS